VSTESTDIWDEWRTREWTFDAQQEFYGKIWELYRDQHCFNLPAFKRALDLVQGIKLKVVELGGWDGELAALGLSERIENWVNYEICVPATNELLTYDGRYASVALDDWFWNSRYDCDLFVASHVLEHLSLSDVRKTLDCVKFWYAYVEAPLGAMPTDWTGYEGSHLLEVGWNGLDDEFYQRGYLPTVLTKESRLYRPRRAVEVF
jgi:hypothetical protein